MREEKTMTSKPRLKRLQIPAAPHPQEFNLSIARSVLNNRVKGRQVAKVCKDPDSWFRQRIGRRDCCP